HAALARIGKVQEDFVLILVEDVILRARENTEGRDVVGGTAEGLVSRARQERRRSWRQRRDDDSAHGGIVLHGERLRRRVCGGLERLHTLKRVSRGNDRASRRGDGSRVGEIGRRRRTNQEGGPVEGEAVQHGHLVDRRAAKVVAEHVRRCERGRAESKRRGGDRPQRWLFHRWHGLRWQHLRRSREICRGG